MPSRPVLIAIAFQAVWIVTALGAAAGSAVPGIVAAFFLLAVHLWLSPARGGALALVLASGLIGLLAESALISCGLLTYPAAWPAHPLLAPAWLVALWLAFAATLPALQALFASWTTPAIAAAGGALGLLSYIAGERLGALGFNEPRWLSYSAVATVWALALPLLLALDARRAAAQR